MNTMGGPEDRFYRVDDSQEMLDKCKSKLMEVDFHVIMNCVVLILGQGVKIENASVVVLCLTLQFVSTDLSERLLHDIYVRFKTRWRLDPR
jgi:tRNA (cmo5U34)-methyltransferase